MYFLGGEKTMANEVALKKKQEEVKELADKFKNRSFNRLSWD